MIGIFRGSELVETLTGSAVQDDPALFLAHANDVELVAVQGRAAKLPWSRVDSPFEESRFVLLDEWSALLGIRPPNCSGRLDPVVERLSSVMDRLAELDASVLERSDTYYGWRRSGDQLLIRAAAAHSRARHGQGSTVPPELAFLKHREKPERLKRIKNAPRVDPNEIRDAFDPTGELARRYVNWEPRLQQQQLAGEIAARLRDGGELVAEAGTGTGKSLAYLVPALAHAMQTGEQVVVATNTRVLQGQLASKDAPVAVQAANAQHPDQLPVVQVLKGRGNYLCLRRWFTEVQSGPTPIDDEAAFRAKVNIWLSITESGEQSELPLDRGGGALFNRVSADGEACDAARCQFQQRNQCFLYRARRAAESAHVVITNHALLLTDVVKEGEALPDSRHLIIDEAHHLEDQATKSFQTANSNRLLNTVLNMLAGDGRRGTAGLIPDIDFLLGDFRIVRQNSPGRESAVAQVREIERSIEKIRASASQFFADLAGTIERMGERSREYANRLRVTPTVRNSAEWQAIERRWDELNLPLASLVSHIASLQSGLPDVISSATGGDDGDDEVFTRTEDVVNRLGVVRHELTRMALEMNDAIFNPKADQV
ncbi:MAG: hypothetical protein M3Y37_10890, partial [Chloroflexota bacterium]|nr:hypothetical protein [Chloroflexota bacterium]